MRICAPTSTDAGLAATPAKATIDRLLGGAIPMMPAAQQILLPPHNPLRRRLPSLTQHPSAARS